MQAVVKTTVEATATHQTREQMLRLGCSGSFQERWVKLGLIDPSGSRSLAGVTEASSCRKRQPFGARGRDSQPSAPVLLLPWPLPRRKERLPERWASAAASPVSFTSRLLVASVTTLPAFNPNPPPRFTPSLSQAPLCSSILQFNFPSLPPSTITVNLKGEAEKHQSGGHGGNWDAFARACVFYCVILCLLVCGEREREGRCVTNRQRRLGFGWH